MFGAGPETIWVSITQAGCPVPSTHGLSTETILFQEINTVYIPTFYFVMEENLATLLKNQEVMKACM